MRKNRISIQKLREMKAKMSDGSSDKIRDTHFESESGDRSQKSAFSMMDDKRPNRERNADQRSQRKTRDGGNGYGYGYANDSYGYYGQNEAEVDITHQIFQYLDIAVRHKWLILAIWLLTMAIGYLYTIRQPLIYKTSYDILINDDNAELVVVGNKPVIKNNLDLSAWQKVATSIPVMTKVVNKLKLEYAPAELKGIISVSPAGKEENIFNVSVQSYDPDEVEAIGKAFFEALVEFDQEKLRQSSNDVLAYLKQQIKLQNEKLGAIDRQIEDYCRKNNITNEQDFDRYLKQLDDYRNQLAQINIELSSLRANIASAEAQLSDEQSNIVNQTTYSEPLKVQLMNLQVELARSLTKYGEMHPKIIAIKRNIENLKQLIEKGVEDKIQIKNFAVNPIKSQLLQQLAQLKGREAAYRTKKIELENYISQIEQRLNQIPGYKEQLESFNRKRASIQNLITVLQQRMYETQLNTNEVVDRIVLLDEISKPLNPSNKKLKINLIAAFVLGLGLGFGLAYLLEMIDNRIKSIHEFERLFDVPIIGVTSHQKRHPFVHKQEKLSENEIKAVRENNKALAVNFRYSIKFGEEKLFAVVSGLNGEGKTFNIFNLAINLANDNLKVLLVDADFWKQRLSQFFVNNKKVGLTTFLTGQIDYSRIVRSTPVENLFFVASGPKPPNVSKLLQSQSMFDFCQRTKKEFDIILFDTPAILLVPEILHLFRHMDSTFSIAQILNTTKNSYKATLKELDVIGADHVGAILNDVKMSVVGSNYYYYTKYGYYKKYYDDGTRSYVKKDKAKPNLGELVVTYFKDSLSRIKNLYQGNAGFGDELPDDLDEKVEMDSMTNFGRWYDVFKGAEEKEKVTEE